ncbi:MAG: orotidine-5'-phosphate decarboxylase [Euryarchaeota archaeon]|nr:orotidine-5'-phosphate decarboxylase [Euryarchaeota archaeon]
MERRHGLILALDVEDAGRALEVCTQVAEHVDAVKVGYPLVLRSGMQVVRRLAELLPVIADFKVADVPHVCAAIARIARDAGASYIIAHGFTGYESVRACAEVLPVFVVADMSHAGAEEFITPVSEEVARRCLSIATGIVAPATRLESLRRLREIAGEKVIISPGVGAQGAAPGSAILAGADYEIVGRAIYSADNPARAAAEIASLTAAALAERGRGA